MTRRVIVTGANGLIGRSTVRALKARGYEAIKLVHRRGVDEEGINVDLLDGPARRKVLDDLGAEGLIHLAWYTGESRWQSPQNALWAQASLDLAADFKAAGGWRAVFAGSCAEYDWRQPVLTETSPIRPASPYGEAKAFAANQLLTNEANGLSLVWGRIFFCYGPGEPEGRLMGDLIRGLRAGEIIDCTDGLQIRDFLHIDDVSAALVHLLDSGMTGAVNIASGEDTQVRDLIMETAKAVGRPDLICLGARARPPADPLRLVGDVSRLKSSGFQPKFNLASGIAATLSEEGFDLP